MLREELNNPLSDDKGCEPGQHQDKGWPIGPITTVGPCPQSTRSGETSYQSPDAGIQNDL